MVKRIFALAGAFLVVLVSFVLPCEAGQINMLEPVLSKTGAYNSNPMPGGPVSIGAARDDGISVYTLQDQVNTYTGSVYIELSVMLDSGSYYYCVQVYRAGVMRARYRLDKINRITSIIGFDEYSNFNYFLNIGALQANGTNTPTNIYPGTLQMQDTELRSRNNTYIGRAYPFELTYIPTNQTSYDCTFQFSFIIPGILEYNDKKYVWDGDPTHIALYQDYDQQLIQIQSPVLDIVLDLQDWKVSFSAYADGTQGNRQVNWNWLAEYVWGVQRQNNLNTDLTSLSNYVLVVAVKPTDADDIIDALAELGSGIGQLDQTLQDIADYVPPAADGVSSDSDLNGQYADAAAGMVPEISESQKAELEQDRSVWYSYLADTLDTVSSEISIFGSFITDLTSNDLIGAILGITLTASLIIFLIKWGLD